MPFSIILLTAVALSMDALQSAFPVGCKWRPIQNMRCFIRSLLLFPRALPLIGYYLATGFIVYIERYDHGLHSLCLLDRY